jgi:hypothetical protein
MKNALSFDKQQKLRDILSEELNEFYSAAIVSSLIVPESRRTPAQTYVVKRFAEVLEKALKDIEKTELTP